MPEDDRAVVGKVLGEGEPQHLRRHELGQRRLAGLDRRCSHVLAVQLDQAEGVGITRPIAHQIYLPTPAVFTTGVAYEADNYIVASGEADLACRITHMPKALFA